MKLYADVVERKAHYTDRQFRVLIEVFVMGLRSTERGLLPHRRALEARLGKKEVGFLFDEGDLTEEEDGVVISGWNAYQSGVLSTDRVQRHRASKTEADTTPDETSMKHDETVTRNSFIPFPSTSISTTSVTTTTTEEDSPPASAPAPAREDGPADPADAYWQITGKYPADKALKWIDDLTEQYGRMSVIAAIASRHREDDDVRTLLGRTTDGLKRDARKLDLQERDEERERIDARPRPVRRRLTPSEVDAAHHRTNEVVKRLMAGATEEQIRAEFGTAAGGTS